jgi:hypothetical protein
MVPDPVAGHVLIWMSSDLWELQGSAWVKVGNVPAGPDTGVAVADPDQHRILSWGGDCQSSTGAYIDSTDLRSWDGSHWSRLPER